MTNQAAQLRQVMQDRRKRAKVLAITSGKGGVGKSNIAANLGICLAAAQKKVLLIDADMSLANLDVIMNLSSKYNISHLFSGRKSVEEIIHVGPEGIEVICGGSGLDQLSDINEFQRQRFLHELSKLQDSSDIIIIDTAAGISRSVVGFCMAADQILVVTTPEATAITDAYAMIKVLAKNKFPGKISLVVNMAENFAEGKKIYRQIAAVVSRFLNTHLYDAGVFLKDERLTSAVRQRKPVVLAYPKSQISLSLATLAAKLSTGSAAGVHSDGFFKKVADWFF
jgi:flagellar biosynthesis protein FlhG